VPSPYVCIFIFKCCVCGTMEVNVNGHFNFEKLCNGDCTTKSCNLEDDGAFLTRGRNIK